MGALKTEPSLAPVGEGRQKKPFLFSTVSLSLASARVSLPFDRPLFSFSLLVAFVISSSRRPVSVPRRTLNWQSAFEGVNIVLFPPRGEKRRRDASFFENNLEKSRSFSLSLSLSLVLKFKEREKRSSYAFFRGINNGVEFLNEFFFLCFDQMSS